MRAIGDHDQQGCRCDGGTVLDLGPTPAARIIDAADYPGSGPGLPMRGGPRGRRIEA